MDITLGEMKKKVIRLLGDEIQETEDYGIIYASGYDADLLLDSIHAAITAIANRVWKANIAEIDETDTLDVPDDFIEVDAIYDNKTGVFLPKLMLAANKTRLMGVETNAWTVTPYGTINFLISLSSDGGLLYYSSRWTLPTSDDEDLEPPQQASTAIALYATSYCLLNQATQQTTLAAFKSKIDSGDRKSVV